MEDDGRGIPAEFDGKLFQRFADVSHRRDSTGLGLFIVKSITEAHGRSVFAGNRRSTTSRPRRTPSDGEVDRDPAKRSRRQFLGELPRPSRLLVSGRTFGETRLKATNALRLRLEQMVAAGSETPEGRAELRSSLTGRLPRVCRLPGRRGGLASPRLEREAAKRRKVSRPSLLPRRLAFARPALARG